MKVAVGTDHAGFPIKQSVIEAVEELGHEVIDVGTFTDAQSVDYPDFAYKVGKTILDGLAERGIIICGSGVGACIAANKMDGIYAAICHDTYSAHQGVEHDGMNVLCLGGRIVGPSLVYEIVQSFLNAQVEEAERHQKRRSKIKGIESGTYKGE
ncbi:MAG TPA: ribose 5-phosphate isomerase B [Anaerolineaceae bacterium]|uniref:Ribose-5-phosphate isomerase n=1 Tax=Anaerolinea thermophila TaxID=167964 RepID=A0A117LHA0_9CHLR|nr:MAG: Ribose-5-phosphate isomerase [Anaerolinea thermophila]HAF62741.1 ribose 5-phosphate isomerase B [Anaerolineaceae bacterium]